MLGSKMTNNSATGDESIKGSKSKSLKKLVVYSKIHLPLFIAALCLAVLGTILSVISPSFLSDITDAITAGIGGEMDYSFIVGIGIMLVCFYALSFAFTSSQGVIMAKVSQNITHSLRKDISKKINKIPLNYYDTTSTGNIMSRATNDVDLIGTTLSQSITSLISSVVMVIGTAIMMFVTNATMAVAAILATMIGFGLMICIIKRSQGYFNRKQTVLGKLNGHIEETYSGQNIVKAYNGEKEAIGAFDEMNAKLYGAEWMSQFLSGLMQPLMHFIGNFGYVVVCIVGAMLVIGGQISFGVIVAFIMYVRLFTQPLSQLAQAATTFQSAAAASERVFEFLEETEVEDAEEEVQPSQSKGQVTFDSVRFGYVEGKTIIKNFSLDVKPGQKIAIVGPTGAGKSTLINLLMRFYELNDGRILIDGEDIANMSYESLRDKFAMVLQDSWLFEGTIRENIVYSNSNVSHEQLEQVCKVTGLYHYIQTLPNGYDTVLDDATNISQGQKQLITIARAMLQNANMLILDEATSSVDTRTEAIIQSAMDRLMQGRTSFVIAHRLSTIKNADVILVLKDGDIIESGSHDVLLSEGGFYANLYNSQFENAA